MSSTRDLHVYESGDGGELSLMNGDLVLSETLFQTIYIALFGGNVESSTLGNEPANQERLDYWGNSLIFSDNPEKQFNSQTEKTLFSTAIDTAGRLKIESAVNSDLFFLKKIVNFSVNVVILTESRVQINVFLTEIENQADRELQFIWDNARQEIITDIQI